MNANGESTENSNEKEPDPASAQPAGQSFENALNPTSFVFVVCQNGSETAAKREITTNHPNLRIAFSRPGFLTFKVDSESPLPTKFVLKSTLARTYGWSLAKSVGENANDMADSISQEPALGECTDLHVWQRELTLPGSKGFEPGVTPLAHEAGSLLLETALKTIRESEQGRATAAGSEAPLSLNRAARPDAPVFDVVLVEPNEWWYGFHFASQTAGRWPGGVPSFDQSKERISRAYFKLKEALLWSGISIAKGETCAEIGSSPGGASELLLEMGAKVIGIDPAEMEPELLKNSDFIHLRRRGHEVKKRDFKDVSWLLADINMAPKYTLDTISDIVRHESTDVKGVVLTLKLSDWEFVQQIPGWMSRLKELGFQVVKARQLAFNRRECCLVGVKDKFLLRTRKRSKKK